jgi:hypothetical protein
VPSAALKNLSKKAKVSMDRAEHLWNKAKDIVKSEYDVSEDDPSFWALRMGITKKMMGLKEMTTFKEYVQRQRDPDEDKFPGSFTDSDGTEWFMTHKFGKRFDSGKKVAEYQSYNQDGSKTGARCWRDLEGNVYPD